jgi:hypothetical protein
VTTRRDLIAQREVQIGNRLGHGVFHRIRKIGQPLGAGREGQVDRQGQDVFGRHQNRRRPRPGAVDRKDSVIDDTP